MSNPAPEDISQWIAASIDCHHLKVVGDGRHFEALIVSEVFAGLSKIKRHQMVYKALGKRMENDIHALSMRTLTPQEFSDQR